MWQGRDRGIKTERAETWAIWQTKVKGFKTGALGQTGALRQRHRGIKAETQGH